MIFRRPLHALTQVSVLMADAQPESIGGQAVVEGVLMRSPRRLAVAVRNPEGGITVQNRTFIPFSRRNRLLSLPILRGAASLIESLVIGVQALNFSIEVQEGRHSSDPDVSKTPASENSASFNSRSDAGSGVSKSKAAPLQEVFETGNKGFSQAPSAKEKWLAAGTLLLSLGMAIALFQLLPYAAAGFITGGTHAHPANPLLFNGSAGIVRISLLLLYLFAIARLPDVARVFQYHGAEHKSIFAHEKREPLTIDNAMAQTRFHPRCGTSYILIVALVCILFFSLFDAALLQFLDYRFPTFFHRFLIHLPFVPVVAGLAFEVLKLSARYDSHFLVKPLIAPGLWLQGITTREPDRDQLEVAIASAKASLA
jgi:uncharacterized protein YqhQ